MPHYGYLADKACGYYYQVYNNASDFIGGEILAETGGEVRGRDQGGDVGHGST